MFKPLKCVHASGVHQGNEENEESCPAPRLCGTVIDKVVAQISKSAVSQVSNLRGAGNSRPPADLEIGDTAGLEACATLR
jgi:hypothetical protein